MYSWKYIEKSFMVLCFVWIIYCYFVISRVIPGDAAAMALGPSASAAAIES